jgi:ribosomal-protein-alanine N-acetyltransferase
LEKIIETQRTYLRKISSDDAVALKTVLGDEKVMEFSLNGAMDDNQIEHFITKCQERYDKDGTAVWAVILKESDEFIGVAGLPIQEVEGEKYMEIAYRLATKFWKKGLATEAAVACRDYAFKKLGKEYLISIIEEKNKPSIAVAQRVGMIFERNATAWDVPVQIHSILKEQ